MDRTESRLSPERRAQLARKGRILYQKSCGAGGAGHCAESFARHQLRQGHIEVVSDLIRFLDDRLAALRTADPQGLFTTTESLAARLRRHLEEVAGPGTPSEPSSTCPDGANPLA
jgi:hypothetical protein